VVRPPSPKKPMTSALPAIRLSTGGRSLSPIEPAAEEQAKEQQ